MRITIALIALFVIASTQAATVENYLQCTEDFVALIPDFTELKEHVEAELWFNVIEDLKKIDHATPKVQEHCGLLLPEPAVGGGNLTACIADAQLIVKSAEAIIANPSNIQADIAELEVIFATLKKAEVDCDFKAESVPSAPETPSNPLTVVSISSQVPSSISAIQVSSIAVSSVGVSSLAVSTIGISTIAVSSPVAISSVGIRTVEIVTVFEGVPPMISTIMAIPSVVSTILQLSSVRTVEVVTVFEGVSTLALSSVFIPSTVIASSLGNQFSSLVEDRQTNIRITIELFLGDIPQSTVQVASVQPSSVSAPLLFVSTVPLSTVVSIPAIPSTIASITPPLSANVTIPVIVANATNSTTA